MKLNMMHQNQLKVQNLHPMALSSEKFYTLQQFRQTAQKKERIRQELTI